MPPPLLRSLFWVLDHCAETGESLAARHATAQTHARLADSLGFTGLWLAEHHFQDLGTAPNPAVVLAAIAQGTKRLRLGPAVSVLPLRDPIQVAEDYALVDLLSGGRLDMGVGSGSQPLEFEGLGCDFESRQQRLDDCLATILERWRTAAAGERGPKSLNVAPVQQPTPPIYVAAMHAESAEAAGRAGHGMLTLVSPMTVALDEVEERLAAHARGLAEAGHPESAAAAIVVAFACVGRTNAEARRVGAPAIGRFIQAMVGVRPDDPDALYDQMRERGTGLFGSAEHVDEQIARYQQLGVRHLAFVSRFGDMPARDAEASLRALAPA